MSPAPRNITGSVAGVALGHGAGARTVSDAPIPAASATPAPFRRLLGEVAWNRLAPAVRTRFAVEPAAGRAIYYAGAMKVVRRSRPGALLAHMCRLIGTPLAPHGGWDVPVRVELRNDPVAGGVVWRRDYAFPGRPKVTVRSVKRLDPRLGLCECACAGIGMTLAVFERDGAIHFESQRYFVRLGRWHVFLPDLLTPGTTSVTHREADGGRFRFTMRIHHPLLGETFYQDGLFTETEVG